MAKAKRFMIVDWAGNVLADGMTFASFEDGWDWIYSNAELLGCDDGDFQDLSVELANTRSARYLHGHPAADQLKIR